MIDIAIIVAFATISILPLICCFSIAYDVESTGKSPMTDRIVQICLTSVAPDGQREVLINTLVNPGIPISQGAIDVHGITDDDVANAPIFAQLAPQLEHHFTDADAVIGYNSSKFDNTMIDEEFIRVGSNFTVASMPQIDVKRLLEHIVPRDLNSVSERYLNRSIEGAHDASVDVVATLDIMDALLALGGMTSMTSLEIASTLSDGFITGDGRIVWEDDRAMIGFGKLNGQYLYDAVSSDRRYFDWILNGADPAQYTWNSRDLRNCIRMAIQAPDEVTFNRYLILTYGAPPHDCFEHVDVTSSMYETEDGYEDEDYAQCALCERDMTDELETMYKDYEPDEDLGREER